MTPSEVGRNAALHRWAREDPTATAVRGQAGLVRRFRTEVDAHAAANGETLTEQERERRTKVRYRLHMQAIRRNLRA